MSAVNRSHAFLRPAMHPLTSQPVSLSFCVSGGIHVAAWMMDGQLPRTVTAVRKRYTGYFPSADDETTVLLTYPKAQTILQASWKWLDSLNTMEVYGRTGSIYSHFRNDSRTHRRAVLLDGAGPDELSSLETNVFVSEILDAASRSPAWGRSIRLQQ